MKTKIAITLVPVSFVLCSCMVYYGLFDRGRHGWRDDGDRMIATEVVSGVPVAQPITDKEREEIKIVAKAFLSAKAKGTWTVNKFNWPPKAMLYMIRDCTEKVPGVCVLDKCIDRYIELCTLHPGADCAGEKKHGWCFGGMVIENLIFINRTAQRDKDLRWLLIHEMSHWVGDLRHGDTMKKMEQAVAAEAPTLMMRSLAPATTPTCGTTK